MHSAHIHILACIVSLLFVQCNSKPEPCKPARQSDTVANPATVLPTSYSGEWEYNFPFYSSKLVINNDGTFTYNDMGCIASNYSAGTWINTGPTIVLKSYNRYMAEGSPTQNTETIEHIQTTGENDNDSLPFLSFVNSSKFYTVTEHDTLYTYFDNVHFRLTGDTLYELEGMGFTTNKKYVKEENNKESSLSIKITNVP